jgi:hypothetical protein
MSLVIIMEITAAIRTLGGTTIVETVIKATEITVAVIKDRLI